MLQPVGAGAGFTTCVRRPLWVTLPVTQAPAALGVSWVAFGAPARPSAAT